MSEKPAGPVAGLQRTRFRPRRARWSLAVLVATALGCLAACAGPPSSGPYATATLNHDQNQIRITPKAPFPGIQPRQVVQAFLAATAGDEGDPTFQVAQEYLADGLGAEWAAQQGIAAGDATIYAKDSPLTPVGIDDAVLDPVPAPAPSSDPAGAAGQTATVKLTVTPMATLSNGGFYTTLQPQDQQRIEVTFHLRKVKVASDKDEQWRIVEKPDKRLISIDDLRRAYQALPVFQPTNASSMDTASVGQIYVVPSDTVGVYQALTNALLRGAGNGSAATGAKVTPNLSDGTVTVELHKVATAASELPRWDAASLATAMSKTFQAAAPALQLGGGTTPFTTLVLKEPGILDATRDIRAASGAIDYPAVYYTSGASVFMAGSAAGTTAGTPGQSTVLDGGASGRTLGKIAVREQRSAGDDVGRPADGTSIRIAAVVTAGADVGDVAVYDKLDPGKPNPGVAPTRWYHAHDPARITDLTWDPIDGSLWIVDDGDLYNVRAPQADRVSTPVLIDRLGSDPYERIRLSPDGRQAVVVTGSDVEKPTNDAPTSALLTRISRPDTRTDIRPGAGDRSDHLQLIRQFAIQPTIGGATAARLHVADIAWAGGRTIVLLAKEPGGAPPKLYKVYADGSQDGRLVDSVEQAEGQSTTRIAAVISDPGSQLVRIFSNGKADDQKPGIYWKNKTFDFFKAGDNPVAATKAIAGP